MAAELESNFGVQPKLVKGGGGIFLVKVGDTSVFSKQEVGRFPEEGEVSELVRQLEA